VAAACVLFKVWLTYIRYHNDLKLDEAFYSDPTLDWFNKCSSPLYNIDRQSLLEVIRSNKRNALVFIVL
jgi:hypothetical protein